MLQQHAVTTARVVGRTFPREAPFAPRSSCAHCSLNTVCVSAGLTGAQLDDFSTLARLKRKVAAGAPLFRSGDALDALYVIHSGSFKTVSTSRNGREKVTGFYLSGETLGLGAINGRQHMQDAVALEDSEVCVIPYGHLERMAHSSPTLQQQLFRALSADILRDDGLLQLAGAMTAEQRVAAFLLSLSNRYKRLGYSPESFVLRMTREDIGSYLGLTIETVSRVITRFRKKGLVDVERREVRLPDPELLSEVLEVW